MILPHSVEKRMKVMAPPLPSVWFLSRLIVDGFIITTIQFDFWPFIALSTSSARGLYVIEIWAYSGTVWVETHYKL